MNSMNNIVLFESSMLTRLGEFTLVEPLAHGVEFDSCSVYRGSEFDSPPEILFTVLIRSNKKVNTIRS